MGLLLTLHLTKSLLVGPLFITFGFITGSLTVLIIKGVKRAWNKLRNVDTTSGAV